MQLAALFLVSLAAFGRSCFSQSTYVHICSLYYEVVSIVMYSILIMLNMVTTARILHAATLFNVLYSPMSFVDTLLQKDCKSILPGCGYS
ncbi:hypothetical protein ScPMuIL_002280 [Solemya velum]